MRKKLWLVKRFFDGAVQRQAGDVKALGLALEAGAVWHGKQVVSQRHAMARGDLEHLMLTVGVEGGPVDGGLILVRRAPVVRNGVPGMAHHKRTTRVRARQAHDE